MKKLLFVFLGICALPLQAQQTTFSGAVGFDGAYATEELPFWFYANTHGLRSALTNGNGYAFVKAEYPTSQSATIAVGVGGLYRDGFEDRFQRAEIYANFQNKWLNLTAGSQRPAEQLDRLSTTNGNILWSGNARPIPGIVAEAPEFLTLNKTFAVDYGIGNYFLNDERYVENTMVHYKRLGIEITVNERHRFQGEIQHYAQWGGTSPELGDLPSGIGDLFKIFIAQNAGDNAPEGEQRNALGNHLGSYDFRYFYDGVKGNFQAYHQHIFEDGSGTGFKNIPDGLWGITYAPKSSIIQRLLYEYTHTTDQSASTNGSGISAGDNYFSNKIYRSGWTYEGATIGTPFIRLAPDGLRIGSNRIKAHHIGITLGHERWALLVKASYVQDFGSPGIPIPEGVDSFLSYAEVSFDTDFGLFKVLTGLDTSSIADTTVAIGAGYAYVLN